MNTAGLLLACVVAAHSDFPSADIVWNSPSADASGSMPIGNGRFGANVWVTPDGALTMYLSHTDAWSEANRIIKLGSLTVAFDPPLDVSRFEQRLELRHGRIAINGGDVRLVIDYDDDSDVMRISGDAGGRIVSARYDSWRNERRDLATNRGELASSWTMQDAPEGITVFESADRSVADDEDVIWLHHNESSIFETTLKHQGMWEHRASFHDPLTGRISGVRLSSSQLHKVDDRTLRSRSELREFDVYVGARCAQDPNPERWVERVNELRFDRSNAAAWQSFDDATWIRACVPKDSPKAEDIARINNAYALAKYMTRCASAGEFAIKFNGSIFTTEPKFVTGESFNPDYRRWGGDYWWQNTRLSYEPMLARGEWDRMESLFGMYERAVKGCATRAKIYYQADGVYFPETMTSFGMYSNRDYGWDRTGRPMNDVNCPWWRWSWQQNLELCDLMIRRYEYSLDREFLERRALPMVRETMKYYASRWLTDPNKTIEISPTQALETFWSDVVNDTPTIAGLHRVLDSVLSIDGVPDEDRAGWTRLRHALPPISEATRDGVPVIAPAERYSPNQMNVENPELYAIHPFALFGVGRTKLDVARNSYAKRHHRNTVGWTQDGMVAAMLGLADEAFANMVAKSRNSHERYRFPAMWGPNFDWLPDQCHNGNVTNVFQLMVLQESNGKILVLPAWPRDIDVSFRLRASRDTIVECSYQNGVVSELKVSPESRRQDVIIGIE